MKFAARKFQDFCLIAIIFLALPILALAGLIVLVKIGISTLLNWLK